MNGRAGVHVVYMCGRYVLQCRCCALLGALGHTAVALFYVVLRNLHACARVYARRTHCSCEGLVMLVSKMFINLVYVYAYVCTYICPDRLLWFQIRTFTTNLICTHVLVRRTRLTWVTGRHVLVRRTRLTWVTGRSNVYACALVMITRACVSAKPLITMTTA